MSPSITEQPLLLGQHRLLRARGQRPRRRTAEQRDELAPLHSITMILALPAHALEAQFSV
jgi:hypothetical protein